MDDVDLGFGEPLDFEFHPTGVAITDGKAQYLIGAVVMNTVVLVAFVCLALCVSWVLGRGQDSFEVGKARAKTPGVLIVPYMFLLPGTSLSSARMLFFPGEAGAGAAVLGAAGLLLWSGGAVLLWRQCIRRISTHAMPSADPRLYPTVDDDAKPFGGVKRAVYYFAFGDRIWISTERDEYFADKYGVIFDCFREGKATFVLAEIVVNMALSLCSVWKPANDFQCHTRNLIITLLMVVFFAAIVYVRPYFAHLENTLAALVAGTGAVAVLFMTIGIWSGASPESFWFTGAGFCLFLSAIVLLAKAVWDMTYYVLDVCLERRSKAREGARSATRAKMCDDNGSMSGGHGDAGEGRLLEVEDPSVELQSFTSFVRPRSGSQNSASERLLPVSPTTLASNLAQRQSPQRDGSHVEGSLLEPQSLRPQRQESSLSTPGVQREGSGSASPPAGVDFDNQPCTPMSGRTRAQLSRFMISGRQPASPTHLAGRGEPPRRVSNASTGVMCLPLHSAGSRLSLRSPTLGDMPHPTSPLSTQKGTPLLRL